MKSTQPQKLWATLGVVACLTCTVCAQPAGQTNYQWSAGGDQTSWSDPANWVQGIVPPNDGTTYALDIYATAASLVPIDVASSDVVAFNDSLFGPMWGQTLDIHGSVHCGWGHFLWGDLNAAVTTINIHPGGSLTANDTIALGTAWWFAGGPNVVMNVYSNGFVGVNWLQHGAHLNIHSNGTVSVTNALNTGTPTGPIFAGGLDNDTTRSINLEYGATLVLASNSTAVVNDWLARGILWAYGAPAAPSDIVIDEANVNWPDRTVVTTTATAPNVITNVSIQLPRPEVFLGGVQQAQVFAQYSSGSQVNVTSTATNLSYLTSDPGVTTIAGAGLVRATGLGTANISAILGTFSNSTSITVVEYTNVTSLIHRYEFSETEGTIASDSVAGPGFEAYLINPGAIFTNDSLSLDGIDGFVQLPFGMLSGLDAVTIETWVNFGVVSNWAVLYTFGDTDGTVGHHYISCQPHTGFDTAQVGIKDGNLEQNPFFTPVLDNYTNLHLVSVFHPEAGYISIYTNGTLATINSNITVTLTNALSTGNPFNYIGKSQYSADPVIRVLMDEFRIYNGPLPAAVISANHALGPNQFIGSDTSVSLAASVSGSNIVLSWPTTSALVEVLTSPSVGPDAVWTSLAVNLTVVGPNYQAVIPAGNASTFFRLAQ